MEIIIGERLKELLRDEGISQGKLAAEIGVNTATVGSWVSGRTWPRIDSLWKLAEYFMVNIDYLVGKKEY